MRFGSLRQQVASAVHLPSRDAWASSRPSLGCPAVARIPLGLPESLMILQAFVFPFSLAVAAFVWHSYRHRKINKIFAAAIGLFVLSLARFPFSNSELWLNFANWLTT